MPDSRPLVLELKPAGALDAEGRRTLWTRFRGEIIARLDALPIDPAYDPGRDSWLGKRASLSGADRRQKDAEASVADINGTPFARGEDYTLYLRRAGESHEIRLVLHARKSRLAPDHLHLETRRRTLIRQLEAIARRYPDLAMVRA